MAQRLNIQFFRLEQEGAAFALAQLFAISGNTKIDKKNSPNVVQAEIREDQVADLWARVAQKNVEFRAEGLPEFQVQILELQEP